MIWRLRELQQGLSSSSLQRCFVLLGCTHQVFTVHKSCLCILSVSIWFSFEIKAGVVFHGMHYLWIRFAAALDSAVSWLWEFNFSFCFLVVLHLTLLCDTIFFHLWMEFCESSAFAPQNQPQSWCRRHLTTPKAEHYKRKAFQSLHQILPGHHGPGWRHPEMGSSFWRMHWLS